MKKTLVIALGALTLSVLTAPLVAKPMKLYLYAVKNNTSKTYCVKIAGTPLLINVGSTIGEKAELVDSKNSATYTVTNKSGTQICEGKYHASSGINANASPMCWISVHTLVVDKVVDKNAKCSWTTESKLCQF